VLDFNSTAMLTIERPHQGLAPFEVDLRLAYEGERKMKEIATATSGNALHLASVFARAYDSLGRAFGHLYKEVGSATIESRKRKAKLVLDEAPRIAKEKGLANSRSPSGAEDVRAAVCYADEEYCRIEEYRNALEAAKELVFCKLQAMRMAYDAVRSLVRGTGAVAGNTVTHTAAHARRPARPRARQGPRGRRSRAGPCGNRPRLEPDVPVSAPVRAPRIRHPRLPRLKGTTLHGFHERPGKADAVAARSSTAPSSTRTADPFAPLASTAPSPSFNYTLRQLLAVAAGLHPPARRHAEGR
jgi:hypothetical protein